MVGRVAGFLGEVRSYCYEMYSRKMNGLGLELSLGRERSFGVEMRQIEVKRFVDERHE